MHTPSRAALQFIGQRNGALLSSATLLQGFVSARFAAAIKNWRAQRTAA